MAKFDYRLVEKSDTWTAQIVRQVTSRRTMVSKKQAGFASEEEAKAWAENELVEFSKNQAERNVRKAEQRRANEEVIALKKEKSAEQKAAYEAARQAEEDDEYED